MHLKNNIFLIITFVLLLFGCTKRPEGVLSQYKMRKVLVQLHKTEGILHAAGYNHGNEETKNDYYQAVLDSYGITQADFDSTIVWYSRSPKVFENIYNKVLEELQSEHDAFMLEEKFAIAPITDLNTPPAILDSMLPKYFTSVDKWEKAYLEIILGSFEKLFMQTDTFAVRNIYLPAIQDSIFNTIEVNKKTRALPKTIKFKQKTVVEKEPSTKSLIKNTLQQSAIKEPL